jgi:hypothetical protein
MKYGITLRSVIISAVVAALILALAVTLTWERRIEVDLSSGLVRIRTKCCSVVLSERFQTDFKDLINGTVGQASTEQWETDSLKTMMSSSSRYYTYGGTSAKFDDLLTKWSLDKVPIEEQRKIAVYFLELLRQHRFDEIKDFVHLSSQEQVALALKGTQR